jgi:hypothetical protein
VAQLPERGIYFPLHQGYFTLLALKFGGAKIDAVYKYC